MADPSIEKKKIPPKPQPVQAQKKKKKNAPDAPQPKWLFPTDEENPVLNPKAKTPEEIQQEKDERERSLKYMKRRVHAAPDRPAPPSELLTLVGIFLTDFGFNSTGRLFTNERKARRELNGWEDAIGQKIEKGTPTLEKIYREWYVEWKAKKLDETSSSDSGSDLSDPESETGVETQANGVDSSDEDSEASSDGLGGSDVEIKDAPTAKGKKGKAAKISSVSSSSSSTSDSDADDEGEKKKSKAKAATASKTKATAKKVKTETNAAPAKPTVVAMINKLKRKAPSSDESSDSDSDSSESSEDGKPAKKIKITATTTTAVASLPNGASDSSSDPDDSDTSEVEKPAAAMSKAEASSESSSSESSDSESSSEGETNLAKTIIDPSVPKASSDSSATVNGDVTKTATSASESDSSSSATSSSNSDETPAKKTPVKKEKKHTGAKPTPLAQLSAQGVQGHVSNQYQSYEYADRAYQDLSVTRGKGFTKEKNKKKRGSYRGGAIDTSGGKGFKFED